MCKAGRASGPGGRVNTPQVAESALRKAQIDIKDREEEERVGSINILLARVNRNTKDNAFSRTSLNSSVYIKLEEKLCCDITVTFHFIILKYFVTIITLYRVFT